jgi:hypothetical protein
MKDLYNLHANTTRSNKDFFLITASYFLGIGFLLDYPNALGLSSLDSEYREIEEAVKAIMSNPVNKMELAAQIAGWLGVYLQDVLTPDEVAKLQHEDYIFILDKLEELSE